MDGRRNKWTLSIMGGVCLLATLISLRFGSISFSTEEVLRAIFHKDEGLASVVLLSSRLPRTLVGGMVGMSLAIAGALLQGVMRNRLASPTTIGATSGATFLAYLTLVAFPQYAALLPMGAILGAVITTVIIYALSYDKGSNPVRLILSGMAVAAIFGAMSNVLRSFYPENLQNAVGFLVGSLNGAGWPQAKLIFPYVFGGLALCFFVPKRMNILVLGEELSLSLGLRTESFRVVVLGIAAVLSGAAIAAGGLISFVGLMVPHICRQFVGSDYRKLLPASALVGYSLVVLCDFIGRMILPIGEISVSIVLSLFGAPFFLYLLRSRRS